MGSYYAHLYDISFYVLLRNPIRRLWSGYWMSAVKGNLEEDPVTKKAITNIYNQSDIHHIHLMNDKIQSDIDALSPNYLLFDELLSMIQIKNTNQSNNDDINEKDIVKLYIKVFSKYDRAPRIMRSC